MFLSESLKKNCHIPWLELTWKKYASFLTRRILGTDGFSHNSLWKDKFFVNIVLLGLPVGIIPLLFHIYIELNEGFLATALGDPIAFLGIVIVILNKKLKARQKKYIASAIMMSFCIFKILVLDSAIQGTFLMLMFGVFATLLFSSKTAYFFVIFNAVTILTFCFITYHNSSINYIGSHRWVIYALSFIFSNFIIVTTIVYVTKGLEKNVEKAQKLSKRLRIEVMESRKKEQKLEESVTHFESLFFFNPLPVIIYKPETLKCIYINKAAIKHYKYSKAEFLDTPIPELLKTTKESFTSKDFNSDYTIIDKHFGKDGTEMTVEVRFSKILLDAAHVHLCIIRDISSEINYLKAVEQQNKSLKEITHLQSHVIRAPVSRILGLISLLKDEIDEYSEADQLLNFLLSSAREIDEIILQIVNQAESDIELLPKKNVT